MPRNPPAASTLRNRNRITNKTHLKIYQGSLEADAIVIPDEDEEKHLLNNLVAGVDAEDANVSAVLTLFFCHVNHHFVAMRSMDCITNTLTNHIYRNITCRRSYLRLIGTKAMKDLRVESQVPLCSQPLFLPQILPESLITMMNCIYPINGRTRQLMQSHLQPLKKTLSMDWAMDSHIIWTKEIRSGSIRIMRKHVVKVPVCRALCLVRGPRHAVQRRRAKTLRHLSPLSFPRMNSSW